MYIDCLTKVYKTATIQEVIWQLSDTTIIRAIRSVQSGGVADPFQEVVCIQHVENSYDDQVESPVYSTTLLPHYLKVQLQLLDQIRNSKDDLLGKRAAWDLYQSVREMIRRDAPDHHLPSDVSRLFQEMGEKDFQMWYDISKGIWPG